MKRIVAISIAALALSLCVAPASALAVDSAQQPTSVTISTQGKAASGSTFDLKSAVIEKIPDQVYTGAELKPAVKVTINGTAVDPSKLEVTYQNNVNAGTAKVMIRGIDKKTYKGNASTTFVVKPKAIKPKLVLSKDKYTYNGEVRTPEVTVKDGTAVLEAGKDYTVAFADGRKNVGVYKVTVTLKGNYSGSAYKKFQIVPKGTSLKKLTPVSKGFKATWAKQATKMATARITGYQIQYSTSSKFKSKKTITVKGYSKLTKKVTKLKAKKKYYVRVRTYKSVSGTKLYSAWSKKKAVTTK